jgi:RNA polymerase sigma-70 factor (ECF subfamily)
MRLLGGRPHEAEDAVQEAWIRAVERLHAFRGESALRTWLCGITVNCARERLRRTFLSEGEIPEVAAAPAADQRLSVEQLLYRLPAGYRAVLVLHDVEGYTHGEIAALLGIEEGTAKSQLSRARRVMRGWLAQRTDHAPAR